MRRMRPQTMQALSDLRIRVFLDGLMVHVEERYPEKVEGREPADVRAELNRLVHKSRRWALTSEAHVTAFVDLSFEWGEDFEEEHERRDVRNVLRDRKIEPGAKLRRVREILNRFEGPDPFEGCEEDLADPGPSPHELPE